MPPEEKVMRHVEYCTKLLHRFSYSLDKVHVAVTEKWKKLIASKFEFLADFEMKKHMELLSTLIGAYRDYRGSIYVDSVYKVWYGGLSQYIRESGTTMPPHIRASLVDVGTILAAVLILHAEYHRAIVCLNDVLFLDSSKSTPRLAILRLVSMTGEWQVLRELLKRETTYDKLPETVVHEPFVKLYTLMLRIHTSDERLSSEEIGAGTCAYHITTDLEFTKFEGAALEHELRVAASCLPGADLIQIGDPLHNRKGLLERAHVLQKSRARAFFAFDQPSGLLKKLTIGEEMLKLACNTSRLYESLKQMINASMVAGILKDAQSNALYYLCYALRSCIPQHVMRATTLLLRTLEYGEKTADKYDMVARTLTELISTFEPEERRTRTVDVDYHFAKIVIGRYDERSLEEFCATWDVLHPALLEVNRKTRKQFFDPNRRPMGLSWMQAESYVDIICRCTGGRNDAQAVDLRKKAFRHVEQAPTELRPYWLLLKFSIDQKNTFPAFNHLFLREWRHRICSHFVRSSSSQAERAFYLSEASLCGVRQTARAYHATPGETYSYSSESEFMEDVRKLPAELTVVQLFIDDANTLWLSRLHRSLEPSTVELLNLDDDDVVSEMQAMIAANIESTLLKDATSFWSTRKKLDKKVGNIVKTIEKKWFGYWRSMLLPHSDEDVKETETNFTILIVPEILSSIPFETMPVFKDHPLVCRYPSFKLLCNLIKATNEVPKAVKCDKSYYILNPGGDLKETEKRVRHVIESYKLDGIRGEAPTSEQIKEVLSVYDVVLYIGHGSGGRYFSRHAIRTSECKAVPILMGCGSVGIECNGSRFDGRSALYDYMIARCPCVIGCLWLVTDGEIDKYLVALLEYCFSHLHATSVDSLADSFATEEGYRVFLRGIAEARKACRLPYLTGGAVVAYGLPIISKID